MNNPDKLLQTHHLDFLHACFDTKEIEKGNLYWKERPLHHFKSKASQAAWNRQFAGKKVGRWDHGHRQIGITHPELGRVHLLEHRLIWLLAYNEAPPPMIDHINRIPFDNRPRNLRATTHRQNRENSLSHPDCTSSGTVRETEQGTFLAEFRPLGADPWHLEFDSRLIATTALNYLSYLYETREGI